jgi:hypothetical protein
MLYDNNWVDRIKPKLKIKNKKKKKKKKGSQKMLLVTYVTILAKTILYI